MHAWQVIWVKKHACMSVYGSPNACLHARWVTLAKCMHTWWVIMISIYACMMVHMNVCMYDGSYECIHAWRFICVYACMTFHMCVCMHDVSYVCMHVRLIILVPMHGYTMVHISLNACRMVPNASMHDGSYISHISLNVWMYARYAILVQMHAYFLGNIGHSACMHDGSY